MQRQRGFTLIELVIVLMVVAILATIAAPSFSRLIENNRISSVTNDLIGLMNYSRSEAIRRGAPVQVIAIGGDLTTGLIVQAGADDLRRQDFPGGNIAITGSVANLVFDARGMLQDPALARTYRICGSSGSRGLDISVTAGGQVRSDGELTCTP